MTLSKLANSSVTTFSNIALTFMLLKKSEKMKIGKKLKSEKNENWDKISLPGRYSLLCEQT